ncbi:MAG: ABC transporter ATP-binding protein [Actinocatenispora sp.]
MPPRVSRWRIVALFAPYRWRLGGLLGLVVVQAAVGVTAPFLLRGIVDDAIPRHDTPLLTLLAAGMLASAAGTAALSVLTNRESTVVGQRVMHDLRLGVHDHLQRMSLAFHTHTRSGETISRITNDIGGVDTVLTTTATGLVQSATTALAVVVALLVLDWRLAVVALLVVPAVLLLTPRLGRRRRRAVAGRQHRMARLTALISESLSVSGILLTRTLGNPGELRRRFTDESREVSRLEVTAAMIGRWSTASRRASLVAVPAIVYWLAGMELAHGAGHQLSLGTIVAFTSMLNRLVAPLAAMQSIGQGLSTSFALFDRIFEVLDLPVAIADRPGAPDLVVRGGEVTLTGVSFRYGDGEDWALRDVHLTIPAGSSVAVVGASGSGKTTLAYLLSRLYEPQDGHIRVDGADVRDVTMASLARTVGLVTQDTYLFHATVADNLRFAAPTATDADLVAACTRARVHDAIAELPDGYDTVVGERGFRFSGGERQRLAIARMLLRDPPVLILDEATSALDTRTERAVRDALGALSAGRTTIAISHRLSTVRTADRIVVLDAGRIVEQGTHRQLLDSSGRYAQLLRTR